MNTYKLFLSACALVISASLGAQPKDFERIEMLKTKFITEKLDLSPEEAQQFWPVYNEYRKALDAIHDRRQQEFNRHQMVKNWEDKSDEELEEFTRKELQDQEKIAKVKLEFLSKFSAAVGKRKAATYYRIEVGFHRKLMQELRRRPRR